MQCTHFQNHDFSAHWKIAESLMIMFCPARAKQTRVCSIERKPFLKDWYLHIILIVVIFHEAKFFLNHSYLRSFAYCKRGVVVAGTHQEVKKCTYSNCCKYAGFLLTDVLYSYMYWLCRGLSNFTLNCSRFLMSAWNIRPSLSPILTSKGLLV